VDELNAYLPRLSQTTVILDCLGMFYISANFEINFSPRSISPNSIGQYCKYDISDHSGPQP